MPAPRSSVCRSRCFPIPLILLSPLGGRLADRYGPRQAAVVANLASVPFVIAFGFADDSIGRRGTGPRQRCHSSGVDARWPGRHGAGEPGRVVGVRARPLRRRGRHRRRDFRRERRLGLRRVRARRSRSPRRAWWLWHCHWLPTFGGRAKRRPSCPKQGVITMSEPASVGRSEVDEARNRSFGAGLVDDPYPDLPAAVARVPRAHGGVSQHFGVTNAIEATGDRLYTVNSFRECVDMLEVGHARSRTSGTSRRST